MVAVPEGAAEYIKNRIFSHKNEEIKDLKL